MTIGVIPVTGNLPFDYFFTLVFVMGLVAIGPAMLFRLLRS
jgi:hypothetical protein